jgi:hypothetical protein
VTSYTATWNVNWHGYFEELFSSIIKMETEKEKNKQNKMKTGIHYGPGNSIFTLKEHIPMCTRLFPLKYYL